MKTAEQIRTKIDKFLSDRSITFTSTYVTTGDTINGEDWAHHKYSLTLVREDHMPASIQIDFHMGIGRNDEPTPTDLLYSLCLDMVDGQLFEDWADNLGYDKDSRKAEKTYNACLEQEKKTKSFFSVTELAELRGLLQDY